MIQNKDDIYSQNMKYSNIDIEKAAPINPKKAFITKIYIKQIYDNYADISYLTQEYNTITDINEKERYIIQDKERLDSYHNGNWYMIGIKAYAIAYIPIRNHSYKMQEIDSGGLWGIESDSGKEYIEEIQKEQIDELKEYLKILNIDIPDNVEIEYINE